MSRELLEAAARAAEIEVTEQRNADMPWTIRVNGKSYPWNPLVDDGDAFRLAVKLGMDVDIDPGDKFDSYTWAMAEHDPTSGLAVLHNGDPYAATRLAIVRAAAAIGADKP